MQYSLKSLLDLLTTCVRFAERRRKIHGHQALLVSRPRLLSFWYALEFQRATRSTTVRGEFAFDRAVVGLLAPSLQGLGDAVLFELWSDGERPFVKAEYLTPQRVGGKAHDRLRQSTSHSSFRRCDVLF